MKVFWSWQSDVPGKTGRHFVRAALKAAIEELKLDPDLDERDEQGLHLDQDRQGVAGSPDLALTILDKIANSTVFVADVTLVGMVTVGEQSKEPKKLINGNVAIELGYAFGKISGSRILMVMNEHYGTRDDLPFDLRGKGGPIMFTLAPNASKKDISSAHKSLTSKLKEAIGLCISGHKEEKRQAVPFPAATEKRGPSLFRSEDEALGQFWNDLPKGFGPEGRVLISAGPSLWLRVMPSAAISRTFSATELKAAATKGGGSISLIPISYSSTMSLHFVREEDGIGLAHTEPLQHIASSTSSFAWIFETSEIWSYDRDLLSFGKTIPFVEKMLADRLEDYSKVLGALGVKPPYRWIAGFTGVSGWELALPEIFGSMPFRRLPVCLSQTIRSEGLFDGASNPMQSLMPLFEEIFRRCGVERKDYLNRG